MGADGRATRPGLAIADGPRLPLRGVAAVTGLGRTLRPATEHPVRPWQGGHRPRGDRTRAGTAGPGRRRCGAATAAWRLRRGRHHPRAARTGRYPLCRRRGLRQRGRHGQGVHETDLQSPWPAARALRRGPRQDWGQAADASTGMPVAVRRKRVLDEISELGWPVFVKPARGGSSIGISKASDIAELHEAIEAAREHDPKVLVEAAIAGLEIECGVLEGTERRAAGHKRARPGPGGGRRGVLRLRGQVPRQCHQHGDPGPDPRRSTAGRYGGSLPPRSTRCPAKGWRGWISSTRRTAGSLVNEINTMPGITPGSGFPLDVGGDRRAAHGSHRPDPAGHAAPSGWPALSRRQGRRGRAVRALQATVRSYDALNRSGTAFLDDGTVVPFGRTAFDAGGLRLLRAGQRVTMSAGQRRPGHGHYAGDSAIAGIDRRIALGCCDLLCDRCDGSPHDLPCELRCGRAAHGGQACRRRPAN